MFYLYILYSISADKYYVGYTANVEARLFQHNYSQRNTYTAKHRPWVLKKAIVLNDNRGFAMKIEKAVKKSKNRIVIEKIVLEIDNLEDLAQLVKVQMCRD